MLQTISLDAVLERYQIRRADELRQQQTISVEDEDSGGEEIVFKRDTTPTGSVSSAQETPLSAQARSPRGPIKDKAGAKPITPPLVPHTPRSGIARGTPRNKGNLTTLQ